MNYKTLRELFYYSTETYTNNKFVCNIGGNYYTYQQFREKTEEISTLLLKNNIKFGDKVAIYSQSMPEWSIALMSCVAYGRVAVPMLPDFAEMEVTNIMTHSESKAIFISKRLYHKLTQEVRDSLDLIIEIDTFTVLKGISQTAEELAASKSELESCNCVPNELDLATIIYTSGTTGSSKGVMLTHKNLTTHVYITQELRPTFEWDVWLSMLPLSHTLECSLSLLLPFSSGSTVYYIDKAPTPSVLLKAFKQVQPTTLIIVPLIIEKIFKGSILPKITAKPAMAKLYNTTLGRKFLHFMAGREMKKMFGGKVRFLGVGGAKLDGNVERFLIESRFPYTIGYGLTECSPLLSGLPPFKNKWQTAGTAVPGVTLRINNPDPITGEGEIVAKGDNIMPGYYKNPEATAEAFTEDGWFRTKDLGHLDKDGNLSIRGRLNSMIVGASGENIYPEEIETVINFHADVTESLVTSEKGLLVAQVCLNPDKMDALNKLKEQGKEEYHKKKRQLIEAYDAKIAEFKREYDHKKEEFTHLYDQKRRELFRAYVVKRDEAVRIYNEKKAEGIKAFETKRAEIEKEIHTYVNSKVNKFSRVSNVELSPKGFEKTATFKIKRYLYKK